MWVPGGSLQCRITASGHVSDDTTYSLIGAAALNFFSFLQTNSFDCFCQSVEQTERMVVDLFAGEFV